MKLTVLDWVALILVIIGGIDSGLGSAFGFDLILGIMSFVGAAILTHYIYILVGLAAVYLAVTLLPRLAKK